MQLAITQMDPLYAFVNQVIPVMVLNVKTLMNVQIAVSVIPMLPALIHQAPICVLAIADTQGMVPTVQYTMIVLKEHTLATRMHRAVSFMMPCMMETRLALAT
jgi:hypothetical protein